MKKYKYIKRKSDKIKQPLIAKIDCLNITGVLKYKYVKKESSKIPIQDWMMIFWIENTIDFEIKHPEAKKIARRENGWTDQQKEGECFIMLKSKKPRNCVAFETFIYV